jgi:hypothetical protein
MLFIHNGAETLLQWAATENQIKQNYKEMK